MGSSAPLEPHRGPAADPARSGSATAAFQALVFLLTWCGYASSNLIRKPLSVSKASMGTELRLSITHLGLLDTASLLPYALFQIYAGKLGDRYGARLILAAGLSLCALSTMAVGTLTSLPHIVFALALCGLGQALCWPACAKALAPWFSDSVRTTVLGLWGTSQAAGGLIGAIFASSLVETMGWRSAFFWPSLAVLAVAAAAYLFLLTPSEAGVIPPNARAAAAQHAAALAAARAAAGAAAQAARAAAQAARAGRRAGRTRAEAEDDAAAGAPVLTAPVESDDEESEMELGGVCMRGAGAEEEGAIALAVLADTRSGPGSGRRSSSGSGNGGNGGGGGEDNDDTESSGTGGSIVPAEAGPRARSHHLHPTAATAPTPSTAATAGTASTSAAVSARAPARGAPMASAFAPAVATPRPAAAGSSLTGGSGSDSDDSDAALAPSSSGVTLLEAFQIPMMPHVTACFLALKLARYVFILWLPMYFTSLGYSARVAGLLATAFELGNAVGSAVNGLLIDKCFGGRKIRMVAVMTSALVGCLLAFIANSAQGHVSLSTAYTSAVIMFAAGFCEPGFVLSGPVAAELGEYGGRDAQASLAGIVNGLGGLGAVAQAPLVSFAVDAWGWSGVFYSVAALCAAGAIVLAPAIKIEEEELQARAARAAAAASAATTDEGDAASGGVGASSSSTLSSSSSLAAVVRRGSALGEVAAKASLLAHTIPLSSSPSVFTANKNSQGNRGNQGSKGSYKGSSGGSGSGYRSAGDVEGDEGCALAAV